MRFSNSQFRGSSMAAVAPLIVILGPTASGKTALSIDLAKKYNGEIICADSRTIYRSMNIGTAKPTAAEMRGVKHHMLDVVDPDQKFTLWNFQQSTKKIIEEIRAIGKIPFLVGGSGLYVDSIVFDYEIAPQSIDYTARQGLEKKTIDNLLMMIKKQHLELPANYKNKRHLIRVLEQGKVNQERLERPVENTITVGITTNKEILETRIRLRAENMIERGLIDETQNLISTYGDQPVFHSNSYGEIQKFLRGEITGREQLIERIVTVDRQLAKKQLTWFRRNKDIAWLDIDSAEEYISNILNTNFKYKYGL